MIGKGELGEGVTGTNGLTTFAVVNEPFLCALRRGEASNSHGLSVIQSTVNRWLKINTELLRGIEAAASF